MFRVGASVARLTRDGFGKNFTTGKDNYNKDVIGCPRCRPKSASDDSALLRVSARLHQGPQQPARRPSPDPRPAVRRASYRRCLQQPRRHRRPQAEGVSKGIAAHGQLELADGFKFEIDHCVSQGQEHDPDRLRRPARDRCRRSRHLQEQPVQPGIPAGGRSRPAVRRGRRLLSRRQRRHDRSMCGCSRPSSARPWAASRAFTDGHVDTKTWAVFGDFTYEFTDQFAVSVGGRYTNDKRHATVFRQILSGGTARPMFGGAWQRRSAAPTSNFEGSAPTRRSRRALSVSFKPNHDHHFYASWSKGFKGGGFDPRGQSTVGDRP